MTPIGSDVKTVAYIGKKALGTWKKIIIPSCMFHVSAQLKMLIDRLYCFMEHTDPKTGEPVMRFEFPTGKKFITIVSRGDNEPAEMLPQLYDHLNEWLNIIPLSLGAASIEFLHQYGAEIDRKSAKNDADLIEKAMVLGEKL
ncbi:MAG: hypothetical protein PF482_22050 [Desulfobacteraceae bacterium]|jgi:multimeric flavodoxin WrbA|nr:hypothetical protein [Desulfobacteraceae bacterium]